MTTFQQFGKITTIASNTFREAVRDRVLYNLIVFVLLITAAAVFLGDLTDGYEARTIVNLGLSAMLMFGVFIAIFVGVGLVSKEIEKRTIYSVLSKPVGRGQFIVGRYLGLCLTLLVNVAVMAVGVTLALLIVGGGRLAPAVWGAVSLIYLELTIITAVAILFSSFSSPALSALLTFMVFIIGHFSASLRDFAVNLGSESAKLFFSFLYYFLPNLSHYSFITSAAHGDVPPISYLLTAIAYTIFYASIVIAASALIFSRRNFK
jgi:ABC-type transport system involved in multi-copper enzyme maturation permease subunit